MKGQLGTMSLIYKYNVTKGSRVNNLHLLLTNMLLSTTLLMFHSSFEYKIPAGHLHERFSREAVHLIMALLVSPSIIIQW